MPSSRSIPTIADYIASASKAVVANGDAASNVRRGAMYERAYGPTAILWTRQSLRDRDMFRSLHFDAATGDKLTSLGDRYGVPRQLDAYGAGVAVIKRATAAAGAGTIWAGTQIGIAGSAGTEIYLTTADWPVSATDTIATPAMRPLVKGARGGVDKGAAFFVDTVFDSTMFVESMSCEAGQDIEEPDVFRARAREAMRSKRVGYVLAIVNALKAAGAVKAVLLASDYSGYALDAGINVAYVGDASGTGSVQIVGQSKVAAESVRVLGCDLEILPMVPTALTVTLTATLWDPVQLQNKRSIDTRIRLAIVRHFADETNAFAYKLDAIKGAVFAAVPEAKDVTLAAPVADVTLSASAWPASLSLYRVGYAAIGVTLGA